MRTNLDVALADPDADADDLRHTAEVVQKSTERMSRLVDDLLVVRAQRKPARSSASESTPAHVVDEAADEFTAPRRRSASRSMRGRDRRCGSTLIDWRCGRRWRTCSPTRCA